MEHEIDPDLLNQIGLELRLSRLNGSSMKQLAELMWSRFGIGCTVSTVWELLTISTPPGRVNYAGSRDPGRGIARPRNPARAIGGMLSPVPAGGDR